MNRLSHLEAQGRQESNQTLDVFSHDSTHVRLVMEAERQSNLARKRATSILQKYSKDEKDDAQENVDDDRNETPDMDRHTYNPYDANRNDGTMHNHIPVKFDVIDNYLNINNGSGDEDDGESQEQKSQNQMFEQFEETTPADMEHISRCLLPLSPKGAPKNKAKRISGQFEFKRINSVLTVVKSADEDGTHHSFQSQNSKTSMGSKMSRGSRSSNGTKKSSGKRRLRRVFSFGSRSKGSVNTGINTDDAMITASRSTSERITKAEKTEAATTSKVLPKVEKEKRQGDLPPKPKPPARRNNSIAPSSKAEASDAGEEEVISVVSELSELSLESVTQQARDRLKKGPIVLSEAMLGEVRIPESICLKKQVKMTKMQQMKRNFSFRKGKF